MPFTITELAPVNQYATIGYSPPIEQTPAVFGSVADGDDATFTTLDAEYQVGGTRYSEVLTVDFPSVTGTPAFYYVRLRARDNPDYVAGLGETHIPSATFVFDFSKVADAPGSTFDNWTGNTSQATGTQFSALARGEVTSPAWFDLSYIGASSPVDTASPSADTWFEANADGGFTAAAAYAALTGSGMRLTLYPMANNNLAPRTSFLDIYEVRLVVAYVQAAPPYVPQERVTPSLRMLQRGGSGGMSGIPRMVGNPTARGSLRRGPGSVY